MYRALIGTLVLLSVVGCGGATASGPGGADACGPNGFPRPEGLAEGCEITVGTCCYHAKDDACAAANCPSAACTVVRTYPGQVECASNTRPSGT